MHHRVPSVVPPLANQPGEEQEERRPQVFLFFNFLNSCDTRLLISRLPPRHIWFFEAQIFNPWSVLVRKLGLCHLRYKPLVTLDFYFQNIHSGSTCEDVWPSLPELFSCSTFHCHSTANQSSGIISILHCNPISNYLFPNIKHSIYEGWLGRDMGSKTVNFSNPDPGYRIQGRIRIDEFTNF